MPKVSVKQNKNAYFRKREELGLTRETAAELLETIPPERIEKIENERSAPHPDEVLLMAEKYRAPELCNHYCSHDCPIGRQYVPEIRIRDLSQIILEMLSSLNAMHKKQELLIDIAADGKIGDNEIDDFISIQKDLEKISVTVEALQLWSERMLADGTIDSEKYRKRKENP